MAETPEQRRKGWFARRSIKKSLWKLRAEQYNDQPPEEQRRGPKYGPTTRGGGSS